MRIFVHILLSLGAFVSSVLEATMSRKDNWEFYQDKQSNWRWRRRDSRQRILNASRHGFKAYSDCVDNARRNGFAEYIRTRA